MLGGRSTQIQIFDPRFRYLATSVWIPAVLFLVLAFCGWVMLSKTVTGRHLYALGGNEQAARLSGIRTDRMKWFAYCMSAVLSSIAGILYICEVSVATPQILGRGYELNSIAAAVVGGCSLQGGIGTAQGTVLGALFLRIVIDGVAKIIKTGADVYEGLIVGVVVVFAVAFSQSDERRQRIPFFAGPLGFVAAVNLALVAGVMAMLIGPTLLAEKTSLDGKFLGLWTAASLFVLLLLIRSRLTGRTRRFAGLIWAATVVGAFFALDQGIPAYRVRAATATIQSLGGKISFDAEGGRKIDLSGSGIGDKELTAIIDRLRALPNVTELSLARTNITDQAATSIKLLTGLKQLDISDTKITRMGKTQLGRTLPDVEITD
jgi:hypothetical protein